MKPQLKLTIGISLFVIALAVLLNACKTSSRLQLSKQSSSQTNVEQSATSTDVTQISRQITGLNNISMKVTKTTFKYNTSVTDPDGKHPVLESTVEESDYKDNSQQIETDKKNQQSTANSNLKASIKESSKEKVKSSNDSEASLSIPWRIYLVAIVAILAALYFFCPPIKIIVDNVFRAIKSKWKKKQS